MSFYQTWSIPPTRSDAYLGERTEVSPEEWEAIYLQDQAAQQGQSPPPQTDFWGPLFQTAAESLPDFFKAFMPGGAPSSQQQEAMILEELREVKEKADAAKALNKNLAIGGGIAVFGLLGALIILKKKK